MTAEELTEYVYKLADAGECSARGGIILANHAGEIDEWRKEVDKRLEALEVAILGQILPEAKGDSDE